MTSYVMKRYLTAGPFVDARLVENSLQQIEAICYTPNGETEEKWVTLEKPLPYRERPEPGDIVVEGPYFIVWMPADHFADSFSEV